MRVIAILLMFFALVLPDPATGATPERIVAIGDLHGDWGAWQRASLAAGLTDRSGRWRGGRTTLVQTGDIVDRGPDSLRILEQLQRWQAEAPRAGGRVVVLIGNHEAMMVTGDLRYVHPGEFAAFRTARSEAVREAFWIATRVEYRAASLARDPALSNAVIRERWLAEVPLGMVEHQQAWAPTGRLGRWLIAQPAVAKIGSTLFAHGGIPIELSPLGIDGINARVRSALLARDGSENSILAVAISPLWYRGHVTRAPDPNEPPVTVRTVPRPSIVDELTQVLSALGATRLVIGHTPSRRGIIIEHGGRLVRIDSAMARHYGGPASWLEIRGEQVTPHLVPTPPEVVRP